MGMLSPDMDYYRAVTDGDGEALLLKAQTEALRSASRG